MDRIQHKRMREIKDDSMNFSLSNLKIVLPLSNMKKMTEGTGLKEMMRSSVSDIMLEISLDIQMEMRSRV